MNWRVITEPSVEPLTLPEIKQALRIDSDNTAWDAELSALLTACRITVEDELGITIHQKTLEATLDDFPCANYITLPRATPLTEIQLFTYTDENGTEADVPSSDYELDTCAQPGRIVLKANCSWPQFNPAPANAVKIQYVAGIPDDSPATSANENLKRGILVMIRDLFDRPAENSGSYAYEHAYKRAMASLLSGAHKEFYF